MVRPRGRTPIVTPLPVERQRFIIPTRAIESTRALTGEGYRKVTTLSLHRTSFRIASLIALAAAVMATLVLTAYPARPVSLAQEEERLVTLGADLTQEQEREVLDLLGADRQDRIIRVTTAETKKASEGIIDLPEDFPSISSTAITCRPQGSGINVRTQNIQSVTAGMYAQSLLTAGITDVDLSVAAPEDAEAEGLTALTGIFKAYRSSPCTGEKLDPQRERLAQRELGITADLGEAVGDQGQAASIVLNTQEQVVSRKLRDRAEIQQVLDNQLRNAGGQEIPDGLRNRLLGLMTDLGSPDVRWGGYAQGWRIQNLNDNQVRISAQPAAQGTPNATGTPDAATPTTTPTATPAGTQTGGDTIEGTVQGVTADGITIARASGGLETIPATANIPVVRDGQPATLSAIQRTDRVSIERDARGKAVRIVATSAAPAAGSVVTGRITQAGGDVLRVRTQDGNTRDIRLANTQGVEVTRNGKNATVRDIRPGDTVTVTLRADDTPARIVARSAPARSNGGNGDSLGWLALIIPLALLARNKDDRPDVQISQRIDQ